MLIGIKVVVIMVVLTCLLDKEKLKTVSDKELIDIYSFPSLNCIYRSDIALELHRRKTNAK